MVEYFLVMCHCHKVEFLTNLSSNWRSLKALSSFEWMAFELSLGYRKVLHVSTENANIKQALASAGRKLLCCVESDMEQKLKIQDNFSFSSKTELF